MKLTPKASLAFKLEAPVFNTVFGSNVIACLTELLDEGSSEFNLANLPVPLAQLAIMNNNLNTAVIAKIDGGRAATAALRAVKSIWDGGFTLTANYISDIAEGDAEFIISTGFTPTKSQTQPASRPGVPAAFKAGINGNRGSIVAGNKNGIPASKAYVFTVATNNASVNYVNDTMVITVGDETVYINVNTRGSIELDNLESGKPYNVSMFAVNSAGSGPASAVQKVIPQ